jgi:hypothetical protein
MGEWHLSGTAEGSYNDGQMKLQCALQREESTDFYQNLFLWEVPTGMATVGAWADEASPCRKLNLQAQMHKVRKAQPKVAGWCRETYQNPWSMSLSSEDAGKEPTEEEGTKRAAPSVETNTYFLNSFISNKNYLDSMS